MFLLSKLWSATERIAEQLLSLARAERFEQLFARVQGKGWGTGVASEAAVAARFLPAHDAVVFDVGANRGEWSSALLARAGNQISRLILVEPQPSLQAVLSAIAADHSQVEVMHCAIGRESGDAILYSDRPGSPLASLTRRHIDYSDIILAQESPIGVRTIFDITGERGISRIDVLKLDIEGHELDALMGAKRLLAQKRIGYIQFEFGSAHIDTRNYFRDFWRFFDGHGYAVGRLGKRGLIPLLKYSEAMETFITTNYGAWPKGPVQALPPEP
jgi:FkbM family methyltransferase